MQNNDNNTKACPETAVNVLTCLHILAHPSHLWMVPLVVSSPFVHFPCAHKLTQPFSRVFTKANSGISFCVYLPCSRIIFILCTQKRCLENPLRYHSCVQLWQRGCLSHCLLFGEHWFQNHQGAQILCLQLLSSIPPEIYFHLGRVGASDQRTRSNNEVRLQSCLTWAVIIWHSGSGVPPLFGNAQGSCLPRSTFHF